MEWTKDLSVGIHELDEQHKTLVECVSAIEQSVSQGERWSEVHSTLVRLRNFTEMHFAVEESLMRIHEYPGLDEHANEHRGFSDSLVALQEASLKTDVRLEMIAFLRRWIEWHIPAHDKPYAFHFLRRSALGGREA